jgi:protein involved in polysaccharide export with SLBB domain
MYRGLSSDSVLYFIDMAGGIDLRRGSFVNVRIQRNGGVRQTVNLYQFLLEGTLPTVQFADGDAVHVGPITNTVGVEGAVNNGASFEFSEPTISASTVLEWGTLRPEATHIRVRRNNSGEVTADVLPLADLDKVMLKPGDRVTVIPEDRRQEIVIGITGEHDGVKEMVVPQNTRLDIVLDKIVLNHRSNIDAVQLFRESVKERQKGLLQQALNRLEHEVWASRSSTDEEAALRLKEADLVQSFIDRARALEPQGLVVLGESLTARDLYLEDSDVIYIPRKSDLITVAGEVNFPTAVAWQPRTRIKAYITKAGGFTRTAQTEDVLLRRVNGEIERVSRGERPEPGDEIMVLPKPNVKNLQLGKAFAEILFQLAVTTRVVTGL